MIMATSSVDLPLEEILSPKFKPESLTKPQLRSLLAEYSGLPVSELPSASAKKEVYLAFFDHYLSKRRTQLLKRTKPEGKGILVVNQDGSMNTTTGTPVKGTSTRRKVEFDLSSGYFSEENPFQSPEKKPRSTRRSTRRTRSTSDDEQITKSDEESKPRRSTRSKKTATKEEPTVPKIPQQAIHSLLTQSRQQLTKKIRVPSFIWKLISFFLFFSVLFLYLHFLSLVPICPTGQACTANSIGDWIFAPWRRLIRDQSWLQLFPLPEEPYFCWPCPAYATCVTDSRTGITTVQCHAGFKLYQSWGGLFGPACKPDPKQQSTVDSLTQNIERFLSERLGESICSCMAKGTFASLPDKIKSLSQLNDECRMKAVFSEKFLKSHFKQVPGPWQDGSKYDAFFDAALKRLSKAVPSIVIIEKHLNNESLFCAISPVYPLTCIIGFTIGSIIRDHWIYILTIAFLVFSIFYLRILSKKKRERHRLSVQFGEAVVTKLVEQEYLNRNDPMVYPSTVPVNQLRDALLVNVSDKDKKYIWKEVCSLIHRNSNIRESVTTLKGDQHRVWEWIGPEVLSPTKSARK